MCRRSVREAAAEEKLEELPKPLRAFNDVPAERMGYEGLVMTDLRRALRTATLAVRLCRDRSDNCLLQYIYD